MGKPAEFKTSVADLAQLSVNVYDNYSLYLKSGGAGAGAANLHPPGFTLVAEKYAESSNYFGQAWRNDKNGEIVIVNRGTVPTVIDAKMDLVIAQGQDVPDSAKAAWLFAERVAADYKGSTVITTGHSKGGYEAQYQNAKLDDSVGGGDTRFAAATFDAPALNPITAKLGQPLGSYSAINISNATDPVSQLTAAYGLQWPGQNVFVPVAGTPPTSNPLGMSEACRRAAVRLNDVLNDVGSMADAFGVSPSQFGGQTGAVGTAQAFDKFLQSCDLKLAGHSSPPLATQLRQDLGDFSLSAALADPTLKGHVVSSVMETVSFGAQEFRQIGKAVLGIYIKGGHGFGEGGDITSTAFVAAVDAKFAGKNLTDATAYQVDGTVYVRLADGQTIWVQPDGRSGSQKIEYFDDGSVLYSSTDVDGYSQYAHRDSDGVLHAQVSDPSGSVVADYVSGRDGGHVELNSTSGDEFYRVSVDETGTSQFTGSNEVGQSVALPEDGSQDMSPPASTEGGQVGPGVAQDVLGSMQSMLSLIQAIESGDTKAIIAASAAMLADFDRLDGGQLLPDGAAAGLNALAAGINLFNAIQDGNGLGMVAAGANLASQAAGMYSQALLDDCMMRSSANMAGAASGLAVIGSIATLVMAIENGNGYSIASSALATTAAAMSAAGEAGLITATETLACIPYLQVAAVAIAFIGMAFTINENIPTREGEATAVWNPDGSVQVLTTASKEDGGGTPTSLLQNLLSSLQETLAGQVDADGKPLYALIPQRLPTIGYSYDPDGFNPYATPGNLYLKWIDENGQEQTRYFDGAGNRDQAPTLMQEFLLRALGAVVPAWEAETVFAQMHDAGALTAPTTGSLEENRARVAQQLHNADWQRPDASVGLPEEDANGISQHFTALTVDLKPEPPAGTGTGRVGRNVDLDAYIEQTDWVQANQGILSIDWDGDGRIVQNEILTNDPDAAAAHARNSLQWLDANHDGKLDASDPAFKALGIWLDVNRNGQTDAGEFASFLDRGIASLDFTSVPPVLRAADGSTLAVTEQHLTADVRGDAYQAAFADTDGDGKADTFAGVLHAKEGGETVLNAVVTHNYTGEAGHTHGGEAAENAGGEVRVDAGSNQIQTASDRQHTQTLAESVVAAGDIPVSSGETQPVEGQTTQTTVDQGDARLASSGQASAGQPQTVETIRQNDPRLISAAPATASDAFAAIRDEWIKSAQSPFSGTGALIGVGIGAVAVPAEAVPLGEDQVAISTTDAIGNNTISHLPADGQISSSATASSEVPAFVSVLVDSLPASARTLPGDAADVLTVAVTPSQVVSVSHVDEPIPETIAALSPLDGAAQPLPAGQDVRLAAPDVVDEQVAGVEDTRYVIDTALILANDTTKNTVTQPLRLTSVFGAEHGTVSLAVDADGVQRITFTPEPDYWGPARFRYIVEDQYGLQSMGRVNLDVAPVNDAPVTAGENISSDEDTGILLTSAQLLANDYDVDSPTVGDVLRIVGVSDAQHGLVKLDADGNVRFLPDHDYFGPAAFTYWVSDGNGGVTPAIVNLEIRPVNDAPVVTGETLSTDEDTVLLIPQAALLSNDSDVDNPHSDLSVFSVRAGQHGTVELMPDGQIRFVPEQDFYGTATFFYTVTDGAGGYTEAMATVDLAPVNDAPIVTGEQFSGNEDEVATFTAASLLANDRDVDDAQSTLTLVAVGNALHGEVRLNPDGSVQFIPEADYFGAASFEYTVSDPHGAKTTGRVDIDLAPVNDAPRLTDDVIAGTEDTALTIEQAALLANDHDVDNPHDALSITKVAGATHGTVSLNPDGSIRFVPDQDYFGDASFTYEVSDGVGGVSTATATIHVAPVNDAPIANDNIVDGRKGVAITMTAAALLADDFDIDNPHSDLHIVGVADADHGTVRLNADGSVTFLPETGYGGYPGAQGHFTYTIADGAGGFATATTTVNLEKINTTPVTVDDGFSGYENTPFVINAAQFLANDSDPDGDPLSLAQVANAQHGSVEIQPDGQVRFTPDAGFSGQASFQYLVADPYGGQTWATAFLNVAHVNSAPIIEAIEYGRPIFGYTLEGLTPPGPQDGIDLDTWKPRPITDEAQALALQGQLYDINGNPVTFTYYEHSGHLKPIGFDMIDGARAYTPTLGGPLQLEWVDNPLLMSGRIIAYDPDGNSSAMVMSIVQGPQHGSGYTGEHVLVDRYMWLIGNVPYSSLQHVSDPISWQYASHLGDPYNGADNFTIRITDSQGATTDVVINATHKGTNTSGGFTPIVLDLNGNGTELLAADQSHVKADVNHDGQTEQIGWAAATDGVLGFDADGDGRISVEETRLTNFVPGAKTDLEALAAFDSNHDGKISNEDAAWSRFKVVQDANGDGEFTQAEHKTLDGAGIAAIGLQRQGETHLDHGNVVFGTIEVTHTDGSKSEAADVMFAGKDVPLPSFALYTEELRTGVVPEVHDHHAFAADAVAQLTAVHDAPTVSPADPHAPPAFPPPTDSEIVQRMVLQFVQAMNTETAPAGPITFVPPHEETFTEVVDRVAQASMVDLGMGYPHTS